jgi:hypothetical protein
MPDTSKPNITCESIARAVLGEPPKRERDELLWCCPNHDDKHPSLKVNTIKNIWFCGPCGQEGGNWWQFAAWLAHLSPDDKPGVAAWLKEKGLELKSSESKIQNQKSKIAAQILREHVYTLPDGTPVARKLRWGSPDPALDKKLKRFSWQRWEGGEWQNGLSLEKQNGLPFYRATRELPIVLTEGEHDADAGATLGIFTTTVGGTGTFQQRHVDALRGRHVVIVSHADPAGRAEAEKRAALIHAAVASVRVVEVPGHKDLAEGVDAGLTRELWEALIADAKDWRPASGADILRDLRDFLARFVALTQPQLDVLAAWAAHTYAVEALDYTPYISITSAEKASGKTILLETLSLVCANSLPVVNLSPAALYHAVEELHPTLFIDEVDSIFHDDSESGEALRGILNAGFKRNNPVGRMVGLGAAQELKFFDTFSAKALAGIGRIPDTISSRSITIQMLREPRGRVEKLRRSKVQPAAKAIANRCAAWIMNNIAALREAEPEIPDALDGREADMTEPLLAVADLAGEQWPERVRDAVTCLCTEMRDRQQSVTLQLLEDIYRVFHPSEDEGLPLPPFDRLPSTEIVRHLHGMESRPWAEFTKGKAMSTITLGKLLSRHNISVSRYRDNGIRVNGYAREQFSDVWQRHGIVDKMLSRDTSQ